MTTYKILGAFLLGGIIAAFGLELAGGGPILGVSSVVSTAEAKVGRPLTPVSVAGQPGEPSVAARLESIIVRRSLATKLPRC